MKNQAIFSSKGKSKKLKCRLLQFLFGALRVKHMIFRVLTVREITIRMAAKNIHKTKEENKETLIPSSTATFQKDNIMYCTAYQA